MDVLLDALGYQARQPHQEDVFTSSTDAHKELLAGGCNPDVIRFYRRPCREQTMRSVVVFSRPRKVTTRRPTVDRAPEALRSALLHVLDQQASDSEGEFDPHHVLSRVLGKMSTPWGPSEKYQEVRNWVNSLTLAQVEQILNEIVLSAREEEFINDKLARAGEDLRVFDGVLVTGMRSEKL
jgi:hypothetical protein